MPTWAACSKFLYDTVKPLNLLPSRYRTSRVLAWAAQLLLALCVVGLAGWWAERHEVDLRRGALQSALEMHALWLRGITGQYAALPAVVGHQPEITGLLIEPPDAARQARVNRYVEEIARRAGATALYVMDLKGKVLATSNWRTADSFLGEVYARRPYFEQALAGRASLFYGVGMTTGIPGLFLAEPIRNGDQVVGVVVVKVALDSLAASWARSPDPVLLRDERGVSFLATYPEWRYRRTRELTPAEQAWLRASMAYGAGSELAAMPWVVREIAPAKGRPNGRAGEYLLRTRVGTRSRSFLALDMLLPEFGWTLTVMTDRDEILQTRNQAWAMSALLMALLMLGAQYWRLRERRYAEQRQARRELEQRVQDRTRELHDAHAFRHAMEDSLLVGMRARDLEGTIIYVNRALCEMTGYESDELLGRRPPYPYWHPDDLEKHWSDSDAALNGQAEPTGFESRVRHKQGQDVITMVYTAPLIDADGVQRGWMSSVVDITDQKRAEERQRVQEAQLQRTARLASLGEMASTLAHELNQPLMALSNFAAAAAALAEAGPKELLVSSLGDIQGQARRASEIVKRIRGVVRQGRSAAETFAVEDLVRTVLGWLKPEIQARHVRVRSELPGDLPALTADRVLVEQVLLNLVLNALQALEGMPVERRQIDVSARMQNGQLYVSVADSGPGVAPEHAARLFDAFFTTKADGLGLGLKICRSIVESQGGALEWRPHPGGGAVFEFNLPVQR